MKRNKFSFLLIGLALAILLTACGTAEEDAEAVETKEVGAETAVSPAEENEENVTESATTNGSRTFTIVPEESEASYTVSEEFFSEAVSRLGVVLGATETVGSTNEVEGEFELDLSESFPLISSRFSVNIRSLTSDQSRRDERIQEQDLESNQYPIAEFTATAIEGFPASYTEGEEISFTLVGDLTIREISKQTTFDMTATLDGDTITGNASTIILMSDFGFDPPAIANFFIVEDETLIQLIFTAKEES